MPNARQRLVVIKARLPCRSSVFHLRDGGLFYRQLLPGISGAASIKWPALRRGKYLAAGYISPLPPQAANDVSDNRTSVGLAAGDPRSGASFAVVEELADRRESMGVCFLAGRPCRDFLRSRDKTEALRPLHRNLIGSARPDDLPAAGSGRWSLSTAADRSGEESLFERFGSQNVA